ncbi:MAG: hypothetical protein ACREH8_20660 [Opitutaceae bacterium]
MNFLPGLIEGCPPRAPGCLLRSNHPIFPDTFRVTTSNAATHFWRIKTRLPERKGQHCRVLARGNLNSCLVEFADGTRVVTSRYAVRKIVA